MHNAAVDRLSKLIAEPSVSTKRQREQDPDLDGPLGLAEGFFSLFLLVVVVLCSVWVTQAADWIDHLQILTLDALLGIVVGTWCTKQRLFSPRLVYCAAVVLALLLAFWETISSYNQNSIPAFIQSIQLWFVVIGSGGSSLDGTPYMFLFVLGFLLLSFFSAFSLYKWRNPWICFLLNGCVLLFNLNVISDVFIMFLVLYLATGFLLIVRFNLYETVKRWDQFNLRYGEDLGWNVMQIGLIIIVGMLILACVLPGSYLNPTMEDLVLNKAGPLAELQALAGRAMGADIGQATPNHGNFQDSWSLGGNPNLTKDVVMKVTYHGADPQYLALVNYDTYDGGWSITHARNDETYPVKANEVLTPQAASTHAVKQDIQVVMSLDEQKPYLIGTSEIISTSLPSYIVEGSGGTVGWLGNNVGMNAGLHYTATSAVSSADVYDLSNIPTPDKAPKHLYDHGGDIEVPIDYYVPQIVTDFTQFPPVLQKDGRIHALAQKIVQDAHAQTMYDQVEALETYLRSHYQYNTNVHPPLSMDPVLWFLFANPNHDGYCNYFSTAMTLMARSLGIPAREVVGYTNGTLENNEYVIRGTDAHSWTQIYFAGYGWINFEPSASFKTFTRPAPHEFPSGISSSSNTGHIVPLPGIQQPGSIKQGTHGGSNSAQWGQGQLYAELFVLLGGLLLLCAIGVLIFLFWWRRLYQRYSLAAQLYGRICLLAEWAGLEHRVSQTPYEYLHQVSDSAFIGQSEMVAALDRLGDIYVRERWADPQSADAPARTGDMGELPRLWQLLRPGLLLYVIRHPFFLGHALSVLWQECMRPVQKYRARRAKKHRIRSI
jgi:transglutaminase-like putative cysteine protease